MNCAPDSQDICEVPNGMSSYEGGLSPLQVQHTRRPAHVAMFPYKGRVRTGCLTCREKKVKCDEQRPCCKRCIRLERTCTYKAQAIIPEPTSNRADDRIRPSCRPQVQTDDGDSNFNVSPTSQRLIRGSATNAHEAVNGLASPSPLEEVLPTPNQHYNALSSPTGSGTFIESPSALALMTSQDIYLCTTIDLLAANEVRTTPSFSYFIQDVKPPMLSTFDQVNWGRMKIHIANLGTHNQAMAAAILAVQSLYKAQTNGLSATHAITLFQAATSIFQTTLNERDQQFDLILIVAFLLSLFEILVLEETGSVFERANAALANRFEAWSVDENQSALCLRIFAWLELIHAAARRGGNPGILPESILAVISKFKGDVPNLSLLESHTDVPTAVYDLISAPIFSFHLSLQRISICVSNLSHYHRSRTSSADQEEVYGLISQLKIKISQLWEARPPLMKFEPAELREQLSPLVSGPLIALIGICHASYYAEIAEIVRTLSDPPLASAEAKQALRQIRGIINGDWNAYNSGKLNSGYLRPLFLYAIESFHRNDTQWAVERMREIKDPICKSDFFASFAESLTETQREKERRVTTKYFCLENYGVSPPLL